MPSTAEIVAAIDAFLASRKRIVGYDSAPTWLLGRTPHERIMKYPLEIEGELRGSQIMIVCFPRYEGLKFRVGLLFPAMICRLDYTDETHGNSISGVLDFNLPPDITGPHYHSWPVNRQFFRGVTKPPELHNAIPFEVPIRSFDAGLRWFCADTNIDPLPPHHRIALPSSDMLI